jgi:tyrosyl-DNA phosphodiesterase 2
LRLRPYRFRQSKGSWKHVVTSGLKEKGREVDFDRDWDERRKPPCSAVRIITWNIDMMSASHEERLNAALRHIQIEVLKCGKDMERAPDPPCIIMLQEVRDKVLPCLLADEWVKRWFCVVPITREKWPDDAQYGNITLVSRSLDIVESQILHFGLSSMQRTALCVNLRLTQVATNEKFVLSFVNTHLESLEQGALARPKQMEMCSRFLRLRGIVGGVVAGDMNAISQEDQSIGRNVGLADAWRDSHEEGYTWGYQGGNEGGKYPPGRLDRIYYLPGKGYKVDEPRKIGVGVTTREGGWVSDHYGLETILHLLKPRSNSA